ncbi:MAG: GNAT family N-acetyltransferase [Actinomycetota bacterium]
MHRFSESQVRLTTGESVTIRAVRPEDTDAVRAFLEGLSDESRRLRYHSSVPIVRWWMVEDVTASDHDQREALLALRGDRVVGVAEWGRDPDDDGRAHVAISVDEQLRRRGLAQILTRRLAAVARQHGLEEFVAHVMPINRPVFGLLDRVAPIGSRRFDGDGVEVVIPLRPQIAAGA